MPDPLETIARAVDASQQMQGLRAEMAQLTAVVQSNLAEQQRLTARMESQVQSLTGGLQDTRERLVKVEGLACQIEPLRQDVTSLRQDFSSLKSMVARYMGIGVGLGIAASTAISVAVTFIK